MVVAVSSSSSSLELPGGSRPEREFCVGTYAGARVRTVSAQCVHRGVTTRACWGGAGQGACCPTDRLLLGRHRASQTAVCTATPALGIQFAVELSSCMQAKVTLKSDLFASLRLQRDVKVPNFYPRARAQAAVLQKHRRLQEHEGSPWLSYAVSRSSRSI